MIVRENRFHDRTDAESLEELNQRVLEEKQALEVGLSRLNQVFNTILAAIIFLGALVVLAFTPGSTEGWIHGAGLLTTLIGWLVVRSLSERQIWRRFDALQIGYARRVVVASIHLGSLPQAVFAAVLTPEGGFYLCRVDQDGAATAIHECFDKAFVITPDCGLEVSSASRMTLGELEEFIGHLAGGLGMVFVVPTNFELQQLRYFRIVERGLTRLN